ATAELAQLLDEEEGLVTVRPLQHQADVLQALHALERTRGLGRLAPRRSARSAIDARARTAETSEREDALVPVLPIHAERIVTDGLNRDDRMFGRLRHGTNSSRLPS